MGRHTGSQAPAYVAPRPPRRSVVLLALVVTVTLLAWGVLVYAAIDFGGRVRSGETTAWVLLVGTAFGAAASLFLALLLGTRLVALLQGRQPPARPRGGRRAAR